MLTKGAIGNLINRYKAVLKKCHLINTFGSLAVASMLVMGAAGTAMGAGEPFLAEQNQEIRGTYERQENKDNTLAGVFTVDYNTSGVSVADGTVFQDNKTLSSAGGVGKIMNGMTIGDNVSFKNNEAAAEAWGGGALYVKLANGKVPSPSDLVTVGENSTFIGNKATVRGGAIALEYGNVSLGQNALFESNEAEYGGAIAMCRMLMTMAITNLSLL